jgi:hypothetical protein
MVPPKHRAYAFMEGNAIEPARLEHREVEMILAHALDRPRDRLLLRALSCRRAELPAVSHFE